MTAPLLDLSGTGYLGLQNHPEYIEIVSRNLQRYGINNPLSRNNVGRFSILEEVERTLSATWRTESACLFSSGFLAGQALASAFRSLRLAYSVQADGHPCYASDSSNNLMSEEAGYIIDAVDPFSGRSELENNAPGASPWLAIDVSHVNGVWSPELITKTKRHRAFFGSLGKAAAFPAGFIAGPCEWVEAARKTSFYTASAATSIAFAASYLEAEPLKNALKTSLDSVINDVFSSLGKTISAYSFPVIYLPTASDEFLAISAAQGIRFSSLPYPSADAPPRVRCVLNARLSPSECKRIIDLIKPYYYPQSSLNLPS